MNNDELRSIIELIDVNPDLFSKCTISKGNKVGITLKK